jgi:hypothetical protein
VHGSVQLPDSVVAGLSTVQTRARHRGQCGPGRRCGRCREHRQRAGSHGPPHGPRPPPPALPRPARRPRHPRPLPGIRPSPRRAWGFMAPEPVPSVSRRPTASASPNASSPGTTRLTASSAPTTSWRSRSWTTRYVRPALTTVRQPVREIGEIAATRLHERVTQAAPPADPVGTRPVLHRPEQHAVRPAPGRRDRCGPARPPGPPDLPATIHRRDRRYRHQVTPRRSP